MASTNQLCECSVLMSSTEEPSDDPSHYLTTTVRENQGRTSKLDPGNLGTTRENYKLVNATAVLSGLLCSNVLIFGSVTDCIYDSGIQKAK